jgi:hypothetical protein
MRQAFAEFAFDWCFLLDADEFLTAPRIEVEGALRAVAPDTLAGMKWRTWIPTSNDYAAHDNPLFSIFRPRRSELRQLIKLAVPGSLATSAILSKGNHSVAVGPSYAEVLKIPLDHAPVRSPEQLLTKVMINLRKTELKSKRGKHESYHLDQMASAVRRWGFRIESAEFLELAERYGLLPGDPISEVDLDVPGLGLASDRICYHGFHDVNLLERLDVFIGSLVGELKCCDADRFSALSHQEGVNEASIHFSATL